MPLVLPRIQMVAGTAAQHKTGIMACICQQLPDVRLQPAGKAAGEGKHDGTVHGQSVLFWTECCACAAHPSGLLLLLQCQMVNSVLWQVGRACCWLLHGGAVCTCDEANQLVVGLDPDANVPLRFVARRLQRPLQEVMRVLESVYTHRVDC